MKCPMITRRATLRIAEQRIAEASRCPGALWIEELDSDLADVVEWWGDGVDLDVAHLDEARREIEALLSSGDASGSDRDQIEGNAAVLLYRALDEACVETGSLDEPGFWCYVSLAHMWNFIVWREPRAFDAASTAEEAKAPRERFHRYVDGSLSHECVPVRMYLRVKALGGVAHQHLAGAVRGGTDFWRSHILRVKAGEHPPLVRAMVRLQADERTRLLTDDLRRFAKELNRTLTNLVPSLLDDEAADELVGELWERQLKRQKRSLGVGAGSSEQAGRQ